MARSPVQMSFPMSLARQAIRYLAPVGLLLLSGCAVTPSAGKHVPAPVSGQVLPVERFRTPQPGIYSGGRIGVEDLGALKAAGIAHVIDLTADSETPGFDEAAAVQERGMGYDNLPIRGADGLTPDSVKAFDQLLREARRPLLVHCASGNRVGALAAMRASLIEGMPVEDAIAEGRRWGLGSLEAEVRRRIQAGR